MMFKGMSRHRAVMVTSFVGLTALGTLSACEELAAVQDGLCCTAFSAGAVIDGPSLEASVEFTAFAQAVADFSGSASAMITTVSNACKSMALDMGVEETAVGPEVVEPDALAAAWCAEARGAIAANVTAMGGVTISFQAPKCTVNASVQANCEGGCSGNVMCQADPGSIEARCTGGEISAKCEGNCTGSCEGSANLAVTCEGTCQGTCEGQCDGAPSGGSCAGTCDGECRGTCTMDANAMVECNGSCSGGCSGTITAPKCDAELDPPSAECSGSVDCQASCNASASAKAECTPPAVEITASGAIDAKVVGALQLHLPNLLMVAQAQAQLQLKNVTAMVELGAKLVVDPGNLSVKAVACLVPIGDAVAAAAVNIEGSISASVSVFGELGI